MAELLFNVGLLLFFIFMFISAGQITIWNDEIWARYWPMMLVGMAIIIFTIKVAIIVKNMPKDKWNFNFAEIFGLKDKAVHKLLICFAWVIGYAAIMETAGFVLATIIFCTGMQTMLGLKLSPKSVLISLGITSLIYAIFVWGLGSSVPRGAGAIYDFGIWLEYLWS